MFCNPETDSSSELRLSWDESEENKKDILFFVSRCYVVYLKRLRDDSISCISTAYKKSRSVSVIDRCLKRNVVVVISLRNEKVHCHSTKCRLLFLMRTIQCPLSLTFSLSQCEKIHKVSGKRISIHDLLIMNFFPQPLDQGSSTKISIPNMIFNYLYLVLVVVFKWSAPTGSAYLVSKF